MDTRLLVKRTAANALQSMLLMGAMVAILGAVGWILGGPLLALLALPIVAALYFFNPLSRTALVLRLSQARPLSAREVPELYAMLGVLCRRAGLDRQPQLYYVPAAPLNAFTVGSRDQSAIALTDGALRAFTLEEMAGVLAHELSHLCHDDIRVMGFADLSARLTHLMALAGQLLLLINLPLLLVGEAVISWPLVLLLVLAPLLSTLAQLALSRTREYHADLGAARLLGDPAGLIRALVKMHDSRLMNMVSLLIPKYGRGAPALLRTHPPTRERIRRLRQLQARPRLHLWEEQLLQGYRSDRQQLIRIPDYHPPVKRRWYF